MDYMAQAIDLPINSLVDALIEKLGPMGAGNSRFTNNNLYDLITDGRYYLPTLNRAERLVSDLTKARPWIKEVFDCDSRTTCFRADIMDASIDLGWKQELACFKLWYDSASLASGPEHLAGYHCTPLIWTIDRKTMDIIPYVVQPKILLDSGEIIPAKFQMPKAEIRTWVLVAG